MSVSSPAPTRNPWAAVGVVAGVLATVLVGYFAWHQVELKDFESRRRDCVDRLLDLSETVSVMKSEFVSNPWNSGGIDQTERATAAGDRLRNSMNRMKAPCVSPDLVPTNGKILYDGFMLCETELNVVVVSTLEIGAAEESYNGCVTWAIETANNVKKLEGPQFLWWKEPPRPTDFAPETH